MNALSPLLQLCEFVPGASVLLVDVSVLTVSPLLWVSSVLEPSFRSGIAIAPCTVLPAPDCFGSLRSFMLLYVNLVVCFLVFSSMKNSIALLVGIALNLQIAFSSMVIFTIL